MSLSSAGPDLGISQSLKKQSGRLTSKRPQKGSLGRGSHGRLIAKIEGHDRPFSGYLANVVAREARRDAESTCGGGNSNKLKGENDDKESFFHDFILFLGRLGTVLV